MAQTFPKFRNGRPLGKASHFCQEEVRQGHSGHSCPRFERAVQPIRDIPNLNHA